MDDVDKRIEAAVANHERVMELRKSSEGKFKVIGVDKFSNEDWVAGEFDTAEEALEFAEEKTDEGKESASGPGVATVYYAYDPDGNFLGGDTW